MGPRSRQKPSEAGLGGVTEGLQPGGLTAPPNYAERYAPALAKGFPWFTMFVSVAATI
jgi:hypothetical protein